jgi:2-methylisocitrate lyase-like PEP mutase family enzyme
MEDKTFPKDTSLRAAGRQELVRIEEFQGKIAAAVDVRRDKDFVVIARTEADIAGLGKVAIVIYSNHAVRAAVGAMRSVFAQIRRAGGIREVAKTLPSVTDIFGLQGDD